MPLFFVLCGPGFLDRLGFGFRFFAARPEFLDASGGIDELLAAGVERMALAADFNFDLGHGGADGKSISAGAGDLGLGMIIRVYIFLHNESSFTYKWQNDKPPQRYLTG